MGRCDSGFGVASVHQLVQAGFTTAQLRTLEQRGEIFEVHDGVYRTASTVLSPRRRLLAACLAIGGVTAASDRAALWLWDLSGDEPPIEVTTASITHPNMSGVVLHVRADLDTAQVSVHRGVPVTSPARTLTDVGTVVDPPTLIHAIDKALFLHLVTLDQLRRLIGCTKGRADAGVIALADALDLRTHAVKDPTILV